MNAEVEALFARYHAAKLVVTLCLDRPSTDRWWLQLYGAAMRFDGESNLVLYMAICAGKVTPDDIERLERFEAAAERLNELTNERR